MELRRNSHHVFRIMYHFVWIPKYRHKIFIEPYRESLKLIIKKIGYDYNIEIVELEIPSDHVHMVVKSEPKVSPSDIMQIIKSISARNFWTQSFFVETVGNANDKIIREYVQNQLNEMDKMEKAANQLKLF